MDTLCFARLDARPISTLDLGNGPLMPSLSAARDRLVADAEAAGITVAISHDFAELVDVNAAAVAAGTWEDLLPTVNPAGRHLHPGNAFWLRGTDAHGDVVAVQAAALFDCTPLSIGERFSDMTVFYDQPERDAPAEEWCTCTSAAAHATKGRVVWTLAGWTRPDFRGRALFPLLQRLNKLACWAQWGPVDAFVSVCDPPIRPNWTEVKMGPRYMDHEPTITYRQSGLGELPMHFIAFSPAQFFGDLAQVVAAG